jgi:hypothetical protein
MLIFEFSIKTKRHEMNIQLRPFRFYLKPYIFKSLHYDYDTMIESILCFSWLIFGFTIVKKMVFTYPLGVDNESSE